MTVFTTLVVQRWVKRHYRTGGYVPGWRRRHRAWMGSSARQRVQNYSPVLSFQLADALTGPGEFINWDPKVEPADSW